MTNETPVAAFRERGINVRATFMRCETFYLVLRL
jgi:hypothetical protein